MDIRPLVDGNVYGMFAWKTYLLHKGKLSPAWKYPGKRERAKIHQPMADVKKDKSASDKHRKIQNERVLADLLRNKPKK